MENQGMLLARQQSTGKVKAFLFATIEVVALLMCIWFISTLDILILAALSYIGAMFYIVTTVIPRYKKSIKQAKESKSKNEKELIS